MDAAGQAILNSGLQLLKGFVQAMERATDRAATLLRWQPTVAAWAAQATKYLQEHPNLPANDQAALQTYINVANDIADQSTLHIDSLMARVPKVLGAATVNGPTSAAVPLAEGLRSVPGWVWGLGVFLVILAIFGPKRK